MTLSHSPIQTAAAAQQRQHAFQREAKEWRVARAVTVTTQRPSPASTPQPGRIVRRHADDVSRLTRAARRLGVPLPA